ncbi:MAG: hypothetical protein JEZ14_17185 [Marinilabiliaceae bacterium]|nr:hypothetical protein [Marinilabiliaceae bacterium]
MEWKTFSSWFLTKFITQLQVLIFLIIHQIVTQSFGEKQKHHNQEWVEYNEIAFKQITTSPLILRGTPP